MVLDHRALDPLLKMAAVVLWLSCLLLRAPEFVTVATAVLAAVATVEGPVRRRRLGWIDALAVALAGVLITLVIIGLVLDVLPGGLTRTSWAVAVAAAALALIAFDGIRVPNPAHRTRSDLRRGLRGWYWYVASGAVVIIAVGISVHATNVANRPPLQLSVVNRDLTTVADVQVSGGRDSGNYELVATTGVNPPARFGPFALDSGQTVHYQVTLLPGIRTTVSLRAAGTTADLRSLILQGASASTSTPPASAPATAPASTSTSGALPFSRRQALLTLTDH